MSRVIDTRKNKYTTPLTMVPGTVAYMPQEALGENPKYTEKLDCFSFGVLAIQVMTRLFPDPLPRKKEVESDLSPDGSVLVAVLETECRKDHIDMVDKTNQLLDIAVECLALKMDDRPPAHELCHRIEMLRSVTAPVKSANLGADPTSNCHEWQETKQQLEEEIAGLRQQLEVLNSSKRSLENGKDECPKCKEVIALKEDLEKQLQGALMSAPSSSRGLSIKHWRVGSSAPYGVANSSSATLQNSMFCCFNTMIYDYDAKHNKWNELPKLSFTRSFAPSIFVHQELGKLIAVMQNMYIMQDGKWVPLPHGKELDFLPWGSVYHEGYILLFGSSGQFVVMQFVDGLVQRSHLTIQPPFASASAKVCSGAVYLLGIKYKQMWPNEVYKYPLEDIIPVTALPKSSWFDFSIFKKLKGSWLKVSPLPLARSTCVSFNDNLLSVGGFANKQASGDIFLYDAEQDKWVAIGRLPTPRYNCLAEVVGNELVVVGGWLNQYAKCNTVEIVTLNF